MSILSAAALSPCNQLANCEANIAATAEQTIHDPPASSKPNPVILALFTATPYSRATTAVVQEGNVNATA